jgi:hypothetical protein
MVVVGGLIHRVFVSGSVAGWFAARARLCPGCAAPWLPGTITCEHCGRFSWSGALLGIVAVTLVIAVAFVEFQVGQLVRQILDAYEVGPIALWSVRYSGTAQQ